MPARRIQMVKILVGETTYEIPAYWCPVCKAHHRIWPNTIPRPASTAPWAKEHPPRWGWNGSLDKPTFTPSVKTSYETHDDGGEFWKLKRLGVKRPEEYPDEAAAKAAVDGLTKAGNLGWIPVRRVRQANKREVIFCHVHVKDGNIIILGDTPGPLGGKTLPLEEWIPWWEKEEGENND